MNKKMNLIKRITENKFFRSVATLMSGTLAAQVISFLISPIMTRLYTEEQIGEYTLLLTAVTMFGSVICGRYDMSIVSEKKQEYVFAIIKLSFVLALVASIFAGVGYSVYFCISDSLNMPFMQNFFWIFVFLFLTGIGHILQSYNNRDREYKLMASVNVTKEVGKAVFLIGLGYAGFGTTGLLVSYLVSCLAGIGRQAKRLKKNIPFIRSATSNEVIAAAKKHCRQPLYSVPASFANSFSYSVINIFVEKLFGTVALAHYSMSYRMLGIPLSLISTNTSKAYYEKAAREYDATGRFKNTFVQTSLFLLAVAVPMTVVLMLFAPYAFEVFFGEGWGVSGEYVRCLAPMFGIRLVVSALTPTMIVCNKQRAELLFQFLFVVSSFFAYFLAAKMQSVNGFMVVISVLFSVVYVIFYIYMFKLSIKRRVEND